MSLNIPIQLIPLFTVEEAPQKANFQKLPGGISIRKHQNQSKYPRMPVRRRVQDLGQFPSIMWESLEKSYGPPFNSSNSSKAINQPKSQIPTRRPIRPFSEGPAIAETKFQLATAPQTITRVSHSGGQPCFYPRSDTRLQRTSSFPVWIIFPFPPRDTNKEELRQITYWTHHQYPQQK